MVKNLPSNTSVIKELRKKLNELYRIPFFFLDVSFSKSLMKIMVVDAVIKQWSLKERLK